MDVITDLDRCPTPSIHSVVTIGAYDGVHLGHRALIARCRAMAAELGASTAVVTFDTHPATVVRPESAPPLLTDLEQKLELLDACGVDHTVVIHFDAQRSQESPEGFVTEVLVDCLGASAVVVGHDFHFGHQRKGNVALLQELGATHGFDVLGLTLVDDGADHQPISSTRIRQLLADGDVSGAAALLGRPHEVRGLVEHGDGRGGPELGFPTANIAVPPGICLPADGIYAGWYVDTDRRAHAAAISLGRRPTFYERADTPLLEAYLLDFDGDLYDQPAAVRFVTRLRDEKRFDSVDALKAQMSADVDAVRHLLASA